MTGKLAGHQRDAMNRLLGKVLKGMPDQVGFFLYCGK